MKHFQGPARAALSLRARALYSFVTRRYCGDAVRDARVAAGSKAGESGLPLLQGFRLSGALEEDLARLRFQILEQFSPGLQSALIRKCQKQLRSKSMQRDLPPSQKWTKAGRQHHAPFWLTQHFSQSPSATSEDSRNRSLCQSVLLSRAL